MQANRPQRRKTGRGAGKQAARAGTSRKRAATGRTLMRRLTALILTLILIAAACVAVTGCTAMEEEDRFLVGVIYLDNSRATAGYTYSHHYGLTKAMIRAGIPEEDLIVEDNVPGTEEDASKAIDRLADAGCDLIIGTSSEYESAFVKAADKYPDIMFAHATGSSSNDTNLVNYYGRIYQARYLAGIAAGYKSLEIEDNNIGYVSAWGTGLAETCADINSFTLGVRSVNPDAVIYVKVINSWGDSKLERTAAVELIDSYGCKLISQDCDSALPQTVAQERGIYGCGYNSDMSDQAPDAHLTAPVWKWDVYYQYILETAMNCKPSEFASKAGNYYGSLADGFVGLAPITENCTPETEEAIALAADLIRNGQWDVFTGTALEFSGEAGSVSVSLIEKPLTAADGTVIVPAGGASVDDETISHTMDYYVEGVVEVG